MYNLFAETHRRSVATCRNFPPIPLRLRNSHRAGPARIDSVAIRTNPHGFGQPEIFLLLLFIFMFFQRASGSRVASTRPASRWAFASRSFRRSHFAEAVRTEDLNPEGSTRSLDSISAANSVGGLRADRAGGRCLGPCSLLQARTFSSG